MTKEELAAKLTGGEYPFNVGFPLSKQAKDAGLVIVYGTSDDLMEFAGAIHDEVGAYNSTTVYVDAEGLLPEWDQIDKDAHDAKDELREYFRREGKGVAIEALWSKEPKYSWTFQTAIPHATFEITEDGEPYCRGIVFALADVQKVVAA